MLQGEGLQCPTRPRRVAIVGTGMVGSTFAYALLLSGLVGEIVLIDVDRERAEGEAMDLNHAVPLSSPARIWAGDYSDCAEAEVVVITAGTAQRPGETRLDLVKRNAAIMKSIVPEVVQHNGSCTLLIAANPVDVLSYVAWKRAGLPWQRVIGSGTVLDTARFRYLLGQHLDVDPRNVHAYIVGEHGDSEVPVWSLANVVGIRLEEFCRREGCRLEGLEREQIFQQVRDAAYEIIQRKGATYYAIGIGLVRIVESILRDQHTVLTVSVPVLDAYCDLEEVYLSLPAVIGREGVERVLHLPLSEQESEALRDSSEVLCDVLEELEPD